MSTPTRWPCLFPSRIYELTYRMLEHAVHAELADLVIINLTEDADTCQLIVDQCIALADCILDRRTEAPWPPSEKVIRVFANLTVRGLENAGEEIAHTGPPAATSDAVFVYLARVVVAGEPATQVFPPGEYVILPAWTAAAMLVSLLPDGAPTWQDHLQMIWDLETTDGINYSALAAIHSRERRRNPRPARARPPPPPGGGAEGGGGRGEKGAKKAGPPPPPPRPPRPADPTAALPW